MPETRSPSSTISECKDHSAAGSTSEGNPAKPEQPSPASRLLDGLEYIRKLVASLLLTVMTVAIVATVIQATTRRSILIDAISVPKDLSDRGFTSGAAAQQIADELTLIWKTSATSKRFGLGTSEATLPKIEVPGMSLSIDGLLYYFRDLFGCVDTKIAGEITIDAPPSGTATEGSKPAKAKFNLRLRIADKGFVYSAREPTDDLQVLFKSSALPLMEQIDPYIAGLTYLHQKDFIGATRMAEFQLRTGAVDDRQWARNLLGLIAENQKRWDIAEQEYTKLAELFPKFSLAEYNISHLLIDRGRYQQSLLHAIKGFEIDKDAQRRAIGYVNIASALDSMQTHSIEFSPRDENAADIVRGIRRVVNDKKLVASLEEGKIPDPDLIVAICQIAAEADPLLANAYRICGDVERRRERFVVAARFFERNIAATPTEPSGYNSMGQIYMAEENWDSAASFFKKAISINPNSYYDHHFLGRALAELGQYEASESEFRTALKLKPDYAWSHLRWAQMLAKKSLNQEAAAAEASKRNAAEHLQTASGLLPTNAQLISEVASVYEELGMMADAASAYHKSP